MKIFDRLFRRVDSPITRTEPALAKRVEAAGLKINYEALAWASRDPTPAVNPFKIPPAPPGALPSGNTPLAMDEAPGIGEWGANGLASFVGAEFIAFFGYPLLSELAQRPEYRKITETWATESTRKWIKLGSSSNDGEGADKTDKIKTLYDAFDRFNVKDVFRRASMSDGFFGRGHIFLDFDANDLELATSIGNGRDEASKLKIAKGSLKGIRSIEPLWVYPTQYNSTNPLKADWYKPQSWYVQGKQVHATRLLTLVAREVPDILKPAYMFGGLSMSQMAKPYIDNWLRTRQSVSDLVHSFSVSGLKTNLSTLLLPGGDDSLASRAALFNGARDNRGMMLVDKDTEEFFNVTTPLGTLDALQAQAQEQMASVSSIPLVKLLGVTPSGLNSSSDGEVRCFYDSVHAYQEHFYAKPLDTVFAIIQLNEFGEVDPDLTYTFEPLWAMNEKETAEVRKIEAETAQIHIDSGALSPEEERARIAADPDTPYADIDVQDMPSLLEEQEAGLVIKGESGEASLEEEAGASTEA